MGRVTRDGTAEPVSRNQILRRNAYREIFIFPVQLTTCRIGLLPGWSILLLYAWPYIHTYILQLNWNLESTERGRCYTFGCMVAIRGGYRMARGWHYTKLSPSSALLLYFSGMYVYFVIVPFVLSFFVLFCLVFLLSLELCRCSSDFFLSSSRPRIGLV